MNQAIADLKQSLAKNPEDREARYHLGMPFLVRLLAEDAGQLEDALNCFEQAAAIQMDFEPSDSNLVTLTSLYKRLQDLADRSRTEWSNGQEERSRHLASKSYAISLDRTSRVRPTRLHRGWRRLAGCFNATISRKCLLTKKRRFAMSYERFVSEWLAISVGPLSPFRSSSSAATYDRDPEAGAIALISALRERCSKLGLADSMVPAAIVR